MESPRADEVATPTSRARRLPPADPRAILGALDLPRTVWSAPDEPTVVAGGAAATITADGPDRFETVRTAANDLFDRLDVPDAPGVARPRLFGGFAFHDRHEATDPWDGFPGARFVLPAVQVALTDDDAWLTVTGTNADPGVDSVSERLEATRDRLTSLPDPGDVARPPGVAGRQRTTTIESWRESVEDAVERIRAGDLRKVVLAQALGTDLERHLSVPDALARLGETYPDCYRFLVQPGEGGSFFGATPERLVSLEGRTVSTGALAGTTGRGDTPEEDEWLAEELLHDEKNRHEHELVADAIRDQLEPLTASLSAGETGVRQLATVQHLWTPITAELDLSGETAGHVLDLVEALHPTPAVGGLPPEAALDTIRETERFDRGWYAAPVGWFDADGDGSFAVAIRSALARDRAATLFAGVGIVEDSDPDAEWDEVELKFRPILDELERD